MKKITILILALMYFLSIHGQEITGKWTGILKVQGTELRVVFNISKTDSGYMSTMDSPDQGAKDIPVSSVSFENPELNLKVAIAGIEYEGELTGDSVIGIFKQRGITFPLNLSQGKIENEIKKKPQEPTEPYPYYSEIVTFPNKTANITLAGTLTLPKKEGKYPAVVLITGSGPQDRNEELLGHKPFLVISDYLTKNGIAVLRYDDRGTAKSTGNFNTATSVDFASDVESAIEYLKTRKEIESKKIGLIGHSEGGLIAPMVASKSKDVAFIVLLAGPGLRGDKIILLQQELIAKTSGIPDDEIQKTKEINSKIFEMILKSDNTEQLKKDITDFVRQLLKETPDDQKPKGMSEDELVNSSVEEVLSPWMIFFLKYDPSPALKKVKCPVLAVNGEKDLQVPAKLNLEAIDKALKKAKNKDVCLKMYPNLNHLFQECKSGLPGEYGTIEQTFSPLVLEEITKWINSHVK